MEVTPSNGNTVQRAAGAILYAVSTGRIPSFYTTDELALAESDAAQSSSHLLSSNTRASHSRDALHFARSNEHMISRTAICSLAQSEPPQPYMLWNGSHRAYIDRIRFWFGSATSVIDYAVSKSIKLPLVRLASGILLGYNFYEYVLFIPRNVWRRVSSKIKSTLPYTPARVRHPSFRWEAGSGERIIYGSGKLIDALISYGVLRPERALLRGDMFPIPESKW